tara:strand:+ start:5168 stop:6088 length:921 start_codon:yes stop_codon:yes gene_type:complete
MSGKFKDINTINHNIDLLYQFSLANKSSLKIFHRSTRDITNLNVLKCSKSGVIVLEKFVTPEEYYEKNIYYTDEFKGLEKTVKGLIRTKPLEDDLRRFKSYKELINGSELLDFGCGRGDFVKLADKISKNTIGLEINKANREYINNIGIKCIKSLSELNEVKFDLITLNHVFHYLNDPINTLIELQKYLKDEGIIIIEVPHARDLLLETFNLESFKKFTFFSESLILHTRESLEKFATNSGLQLKNIKGIQRYPISNHYNWLLNSKPSGHEIFPHLNNDNFHNHYEKLLDRINQTDTLIGFFTKNI